MEVDMSSTSVLGITDYVVIGVMLLVSGCMGIYFRFTGGRQKTTDEFLLANRSMSIAPVAFSLMATNMSAVSILGIPAETYMYGIQHIIWCAALPVGCLIACYGVLPVFFQMELSTTHEYLERRYGKTARTVGSAFFTLQMVFYMAVVLYSPSVALNAVTGLSMWTSVATLSVVCTFYCSFGGLKAVLWTDVFQAVLMYVTILAVFIGAAINFGSFGELFQVANDGGRLMLFNMSPSPFERYTFWISFVSGAFFSLSSYISNQAQFQRMASVGSLKKAQKALFWSLPLIIIFMTLCYCDGIAVYSTYHDCDPMQQPGKKLDSPNQLMPYTILKMFGSIPGLTGLCIAGIFSASLSSVSSALNSLTAVAIEDFIRPFCFCKHLTESGMAFIAKITAIGFGGLCLLLIFIVANFKSVYEATVITNGIARGPILGIFILGIFTKTANEPGMLIGLTAGFIINSWMGFGYYAAKLKIPTLPRSTAGCATVSNITSHFTISPDDTTFELNTTVNLSSLTVGEEKYVFPLYRISYLLFPVIGMMVVILVGYIASLIIGIWKKYPVVDSYFLSPFVRKWYFTDLPKPSLEKEVALKSKVNNEDTHPDIGYGVIKTAEV